MMQRCVSIFIVVILSLLVAYGGSGVNAYFFCCGKCPTEGMVAPITDSCCESSSLMPDGLDSMCDRCSQCDSVGFQANHRECGVERITFDWQWFQSNPIQLQPIVVDLDDCLFSQSFPDFSTEGLLLVFCDENRRTQHPPNLSKRDYFSLLTTLVI